jgi:cytochrome c oxidase assembly protein subunit 15
MMGSSASFPSATVAGGVSGGVWGGHRLLYVLTAALTGVLVTSGAIVCVTDASSGCPDWPGCYGRLLPPLQLKSVLEWSHRVVAALTLPLLLWTAALGWRRYGRQRWLRWPPTLAIASMLAVVAFGAAAVLWGLPPVLAALDLGAALLTLALVVSAAVVASDLHRAPRPAARLRYPDARAQLAPYTLLLLFAVLVGGVLVAEPGSVVRCVSLPRWDPRAPAGAVSGAAGLRLVAGGVASALLIVVALRAWRAHRALAASLLGLLAAELAVGAWLSRFGLADVALVIYVTVAIALWAAAVALTVALGLDGSASSPSPD